MNRISSVLVGQWDIVSYEHTKIDSSGNRYTLINEENVGRWDFYVDPIIGEEGPFIYAFEYDGSQRFQYDSGYVKISEEGKRFIIIGPSIGNDIHFNIDEFTGNELLLNQYAPNQDTATYLLIIRLAKK
ncbi:MAG: hypothetical protein N2167_09730 [Flavobacteriales bacterium]|nr:hypothetical protein [Flavobacteriales bacterium]